MYAVVMVFHGTLAITMLERAPRVNKEIKHTHYLLGRGVVSDSYVDIYFFSGKKERQEQRVRVAWGEGGESEAEER